MFFGALLAVCTFTSASARVDPMAGVTPVFCTHGSIGLIPSSPPPGFESEFAVVVVQIDSPREIANAAVSEFALFDAAGKETKFNRVVAVEEFHRAHVATEGSFAHYLNSGGTLPCDAGEWPT